MKRLILGAIAVAMLAAAPSTVVLAKQDKVDVCHAAGQAGTTHFVTLNVPATSTGYPKGHFTENGTQEAGHEEDYLGPCQTEPTATPTPSPSPSATPSPSPSSTPSPTASPTATPPPSPSPTSSTPSATATPVTPTVPPCDLPEGCPSQTDAPAPTLPPTDTEDGALGPDAGLSLIVIGAILFFAGVVAYRFQHRRKDEEL